MMTLPKFTNPNPSIDELHNEEQRLCSQADKMLEQTKLLDSLSKFGEILPIDGSYAYQLMVYPDIDLGLTCGSVTKEEFSNLVALVVKSKWIRKVSTADTVNFEPLHSGRPKGYWIGIEIPFEGDRWGVDCWLQEAEWMTDNPESYLNKLTNIDPNKKDAILSIKYQLIFKGLYGKQYFSNDVYDAVINNDITSVEEFLKLEH